MKTVISTLPVAASGTPIRVDREHVQMPCLVAVDQPLLDVSVVNTKETESETGGCDDDTKQRCSVYSSFWKIDNPFGMRGDTSSMQVTVSSAVSGLIDHAFFQADKPLLSHQKLYRIRLLEQQIDIASPNTRGHIADAVARTSTVFISYRRQDTNGICGRLFDRLVARFGRDRVFRDFDSIPIGEDFLDHIESGILRSSLVLVLIGSDWNAALSPTGLSRLHAPNDPVRIEIELAMKWRIPLLPILVGGVDMPDPIDLPQSIQLLARINAGQVRGDPDFESDVNRLIDGMRLIIHRKLRLL